MTIPKQAIEAVAIHMAGEARKPDNFYEYPHSEFDRARYRERASTALEAASPHIEAELRAKIAAEIRAAQYEVESVHQIHGTRCLCGFDTNGRSRSATEHITQSLNAARIAEGKQ